MKGIIEHKGNIAQVKKQPLQRSCAIKLRLPSEKVTVIAVGFSSGSVLSA